MKANERKQRKALMSQMQLLGEVASTETALFHQTAAAKYGLGITDMKTLSILLREGPRTAGQIAQRLNLTTGAVTSVIDRLEKRNFARRVRDARDRRKVIVTANQDALKSEGNVYNSMGESFEKLLESYTTLELTFLVQFHEASIELTKLEIAKLTKRSTGGSPGE